MIAVFKKKGTIHTKWQIIIDSTAETGYAVGRNGDIFLARIICRSFDELPVFRMKCEEEIRKEFTRDPNEPPSPGPLYE